jgi:hypothetical protein
MFLLPKSCQNAKRTFSKARKYEEKRPQVKERATDAQSQALCDSGCTGFFDDLRVRIQSAEEIIKLIDDDADIGILVLAAGTGKEGTRSACLQPGQDGRHVSYTSGPRTGASERRGNRRELLALVFPRRRAGAEPASRDKH